MTQQWRWVGDRALLRSFEEARIVEANRAALGCRAEIAALSSPEVEDVVPGARSVLVVLRPGASPPDELLDILERDEFVSLDAVRRVREIPVRYGGEDGPDLAEVARMVGMTVSQVIATHQAGDYVVGFVGFSPGFPYLLGLDPALATPRLETPRVRVQAGSVGIGGAYTGIYPAATPGGWRVIGRTDVVLFDPMRDPPALVEPGERVRFVVR